MLGKNQFRVDSYADLSQERIKALVLFYVPMIGNDAYSLYSFLVAKGSSVFTELSSLLNSLNISVDSFEERLSELNRYRLVKTLKHQTEDRYILVINNPLTVNEFINDDILVREFILKTSGPYYRSLITGYKGISDYSSYEDVSVKLDLSSLADWTEDKETFVSSSGNNTSLSFNSLFDINRFLSDLSYSIFPLRYRTEENLREIARLADLYSISYDKMRIIVKEAASYEGNSFDLELLKKRCMYAESEFRSVDVSSYRIPCQLYLMNLMNGKELTPVDKRVLIRLSDDYHLNPEVINVLLEHCLKNCDNRLLESYLYPIASDLHRNNVVTYKQAIDRLDRFSGRKTVSEDSSDYDDRNNPVFSIEELKELMNNRGNNG